MKEELCIKEGISERLKLLGYVLCALLSVFLLSLCISNKAEALSGKATQGWYGLGNGSSNTNTGYLWSSNWVDLNQSVTWTTRIFPETGIYAPNNISFAAQIPVTAADKAEDGGLYFKGTVTVRIGLGAGTTATQYVGQPSTYNIVNASMFAVGIDATIGIYDARWAVENMSCTHYPTSTSSPSTYATANCTIQFSGSYSKFVNNGTFWLSWRLNGNAGTNNGQSGWFGVSTYGTMPANRNSWNLISGSSIGEYDITFYKPENPSTTPDYTDKFNDLITQQTVTNGKLDQLNESVNNLGDKFESAANGAADSINDNNNAHWEKEENAANDALNSDNGAPDTSQLQDQSNGYFDIFNQIFNAEAGSCKLPRITAYGFDLGELDLCAYTPPDWLRTALGAVATIAAAWCGILVVKRIFNIATGAI